MNDKSDPPRDNRMYGMPAPTVREMLISRIEGFTGSLETVPYHLISIQDLEKILAALAKSK